MINVVCWVEGEEFYDYLRLAIRSVRRAMKDARVVLVAREGIDLSVFDADELMNLPLSQGNFVRSQFEAFRAVRGRSIFIGADTLFLGDVSGTLSVLDEGEIALPHIMDRRFNYDAGIIFANNAQGFFDALLGEPVYRAKEYEGPTPTLEAYNRVAEGWGTMAIAGSIYSYVPRSAVDPCEKALIVHFRGPRKAWMKAVANRKGIV